MDKEKREINVATAIVDTKNEWQSLSGFSFSFCPLLKKFTEKIEALFLSISNLIFRLFFRYLGIIASENAYFVFLYKLCRFKMYFHSRVSSIIKSVQFNFNRSSKFFCPLQKNLSLRTSEWNKGEWTSFPTENSFSTYAWRHTRERDGREGGTEKRPMTYAMLLQLNAYLQLINNVSFRFVWNCTSSENSTASIITIISTTRSWCIVLF